MNITNVITIITNIIKNTVNETIKLNMLNFKYLIEEKYYDDSKYIFIEDEILDIGNLYLIGEGDKKNVLDVIVI